MSRATFGLNAQIWQPWTPNSCCTAFARAVDSELNRPKSANSLITQHNRESDLGAGWLAGRVFKTFSWRAPLRLRPNQIFTTQVNVKT
jgi:hypothetical protein